MDGSSETPASTTGSSGAESDSGANPRPPPLPTTSPDFAVSLYIPGMEALEVPIALRLYQESLSLRHDDINLLDEGSEKAVGEGDGSASRDHDQHHDGRGGGGGGSRAAFSRLELLPNSWSWGSQVREAPIMVRQGGALISVTMSSQQFATVRTSQFHNRSAAV